MKPILYGLAGMKLLLYHLLLKKMAFFTFLSFLLSKISFILASLVALKQFFYMPTQHRSADSNKLEVVHIPVRKLRHNKQEKEKDSYYDESNFIPVTYSPETVFDTTPSYFDFPYGGINPETFESSEENFNGNFDGKFNNQNDFNGDDLKLNYDEKFNEIYNEHFKDNLSDSLDRSETNNEKNYYKNHVHSPFI